MRFTALSVLILALFASIAPRTALANTVRTPHASAALIAENQSLTPGHTNWVGLLLSPQPGWHTYWRNPGDAGLPTRLHWRLPEGVTAGAIVWPAPRRIMFSGIANYGYDHPTLHLVPIRLPSHWPDNRPLTLRAHARWLICKTICVPESADLSLRLPVRSGPARPDPRHVAAFATARAALPRPMPTDWHSRYAINNGVFSLAVKRNNQKPVKATFFPDAGSLIDQSAIQRQADNGRKLRLSVPVSSHYRAPSAAVHGVLELTTPNNQVRAYIIKATRGAVVPVTKSDRSPSPVPAVHDTTTLGLGLALLFALLGGVLLNLMPCVFPILSIKTLALVKSRDMARRAQRRHGHAYAVGVILSFLAIAGALMGLRAGGEALGWGFQLQSPIFVAVLACVMFVLGLSMSGVVTFGNRFMGFGHALTRGGGYTASFFAGVLAVVVATPCSAPFMGSALGYALTQPVAAALAIFAVLGLGLALPFLLIGWFPQLGRWLPRPGAWMESFKQLMAFPLYLSAVWLTWILTRQQGADAAALLLSAMILLALGFWARSRWPRTHVTQGLLLLCIVGTGLLLAQPVISTEQANQAAVQPSRTAAIQPYSPTRLAQLRKQGRTVFVDFTADWCLTCKVNEHVTLASAPVRRAFKRQHVAWLQGDWTRATPVITRALAHFGRSGVPLYVVYRKGGKAKVLPQILTPETVVDAVTPKAGIDR